MDESLRILILEDNPTDAELVQFELREAGLEFTSKVVMIEKDFIRELQEFLPDLILSDYDLPAYNGSLALSEAKRRCPDIPFILVTGAIGEDRAIEILTQGAKDYVLKTRLRQRLVPAIQRALAEAEEHRARKQAEAELREAHRTLEERVKIRTAELEAEIAARKKMEEALRNSERRLRTLVQTIPDIIWLKDKDGVYLSCNAMFERFFGAREADIVGKTDYDFVDRELADAFREHDRKAMTAAKPTSEEDWITFADDGRRALMDAIKTPMYDAQGTLIGVLGIGRDITERKQMEEELQLTLNSLRKAIGATIQVMVAAVEARDPYTSGHQLRSADLARAIATEMELPQDRIDGLRMAGSIHDIGKLSIPAEILSKPAKLTEIEFSLIKEHSQIGFEMLKDVESPWPLAQIVYQHHERMDGSGYPQNLKGDDILMEARIMAVADVVESMASHRPYRPALGLEVALEEIEKNKGILYDDAVADVCLRLFRKKGFQLVAI